MILPLALALAAVAAAQSGDNARPSEEELFGGAPPAEGAPKPDPSAPSTSAPTSTRPSEEELFGGAPPKEEGPSPGATAPSRPSEGELFGPKGSPAAEASPQGTVPREKEDALKVGGMLYLRANTYAQQGQRPANWGFQSPNLLDTYLDVRPNDRVRGFVLGRLFYDPTISPANPTASAAALTLTPASLFNEQVTNPQGVLDQLWINFDIDHRAFVTAGRQHVKWGVGHFWNPTDYLHPVRLDPLAVFDQRTGTTMVKVHVPWESRGWNFYGMTVFEDIAGQNPVNAEGVPDGTNRLGRIGVGGRAEVVLGQVELGADALAQDGHRPRFGLDMSAGIWDIDLYAEAALRSQVDIPRWCPVPGASSTDSLFQTSSSAGRYARCDPYGFIPQVVVGASYSVKYSDEDSVTFGAEYFYDKSGYSGPQIYPVLLGVSQLSPYATIPGTTVANPVAGQPNPFTPFYLGRNYLGAYVSLPNPGSWNNTTFTLSVIGDLSDKSFTARLDHSVLVNTYLRIETYIAGDFGAQEGEFRLGFDIPSQVLVSQPPPAVPFPAMSNPPMILNAGAALRVTL